MSATVKVDGLGRLFAKIAKRISYSKKTFQKNVKVGFSANYATHVHENTEIPHVVGQAKFLEQPLRENFDQYKKVVRDSLLLGMTGAQALMRAGLALQRDAQDKTPVDTGFLRSSAFTELE